MPSKFQSWCIFVGFLEGKCRHVGTKIGSKIDANFERWFFENTLFFLRKNNDFEGSGGWSWHQKSIKNPLKKELNLGRPLGIVFSWILVDFPLIFGQVSGRCFARSLIEFSMMCYLLARFLVDCSSAVAGTQLCCALDPPRQALCLRMAYRVPYSNLLSYPTSL